MKTTNTPPSLSLRILTKKYKVAIILVSIALALAVVGIVLASVGWGSDHEENEELKQDTNEKIKQLQKEINLLIKIVMNQTKQIDVLTRDQGNLRDFSHKISSNLGHYIKIPHVLHLLEICVVNKNPNLNECRDFIKRLNGCGEQLVDCDNIAKNVCEVNRKEDKKNCGVCGYVARNGQCIDGVEPDVDPIICPIAGYEVCNGACTDVPSDVNNCGSCGFNCSAHQNANFNPFCENGVCITDSQQPCIDGYTECGSSCVNFQNDPLNCGSCNYNCENAIPNSISYCQSGRCQINQTDPCLPGFEECDNDICVDVSNDPKNCGGCDIDCNSDLPNGNNFCSNGVCYPNQTDPCLPGFAYCPAAPYYQHDPPRTDICVNTTSDANNCGSCYVDCNILSACLSPPDSTYYYEQCDNPFDPSKPNPTVFTTFYPNTAYCDNSRCFYPHNNYGDKLECSAEANYASPYGELNNIQGVVQYSTGDCDPLNCNACGVQNEYCCDN